MSTTIQGVSRVGAPDYKFQTLDQEKVKARIQLFTTDSLEKVRAANVGASQLSLPTTEPAQQAAMANVFKNANPEQQAVLVEAGNQLYQGALSVSHAASTTGIPEEVGAPLTYAFEQYVTTQAEAGVEEACNGVIYMALGGAEQDLYDIATELQANIDNKKDIRENLTAAKEDLADFKGQLAECEGEGPWKFEIRDENGEFKTVTMTKEEAAEYQTSLESGIANLEDAYQTATDLTPMLQMRVQEAQQKYMQAMQMLSNMIKNWHDTAKAIIQNMR